MTTLASLLTKEEQRYQVGYKYRLYPTKDQQEHLAKTFGCCRFVYNQALAYTIVAYQQYKANLIAGFRQEYPLCSQTLSPGTILKQWQIS